MTSIKRPNTASKASGLGYVAHTLLCASLAGLMSFGSLQAQGTRGSADSGNGGLILNSNTGSLNVPAQGFQQQGFQQQGFNTRGSSAVGGTLNAAPLQIISPPTIATTNARGANISFDNGSTGVVGNAPPIIASSPSSSATTTITTTSGGSVDNYYVVNSFRDYGDGLPLVSYDYEVMDKGHIEDTYFGRPTRDVRHVVGGGIVGIVSDDGAAARVGQRQREVERQQNQVTRSQTARVSTTRSQPIRSTSTRTSTRSYSRVDRNKPTYIGGVKPGVQVALPRRKAKPPTRRTINRRSVASNSSSRSSSTRKPKSIFTQPKVQTTARPAPTRNTTITRKPKKPTQFVLGNAMPGLNEPEKKAAPTIKPPEEATQVASTETKAVPQPAKPATPKYLIKIVFDENSAELKEQVKPALANLAGRMKADKDMQIQLSSYASGANARRMSLTRALQVRANLIAQGIDSARMIVKTKGDKAEGGEKDRLEIIEVN